MLEEKKGKLSKLFRTMHTKYSKVAGNANVPEFLQKIKTKQAKSQKMNIGKWMKPSNSVIFVSKIKPHRKVVIQCEDDLSRQKLKSVDSTVRAGEKFEE